MLLIEKLVLKTFVYGDLYRYDVEKREWKLVSSPNSPPPRSAHQAVAWKNHLYIFGKVALTRLVNCPFVVLSLNVVSDFYFIFNIFTFLHIGGEFTSPNQERFHHYKVSPLSSSLFLSFSLCERTLLFAS